MDAKGFEILQGEVLKHVAVVSEPLENDNARFVTVESTAMRDAAYIMNRLDTAGVLHDSRERRADAPSLVIESMSTYVELEGVLHTVLLFRDTAVE